MEPLGCPEEFGKKVRPCAMRIHSGAFRPEMEKFGKGGEEKNLPRVLATKPPWTITAFRGTEKSLNLDRHPKRMRKER